MNYESIREYLERHNTEEGVIKACEAVGVVWEVQAYDNTPVGAYYAVGTTLDEVCDEILEALTA
jgi:hypothetical protein